MRLSKINVKQSDIIAQQTHLQLGTTNQHQSMQKLIKEQSSWVQDVKVSPIVEMAMNVKFEEERLRHNKELNLRVCGLPKPSDPFKSNMEFLHETVDLKNIMVEKAWTAHDDSLIIRFRSATDQLHALRSKKNFLLCLPRSTWMLISLDFK